MVITLGISALFHDAAAALVVDGEMVAAAQEERFSRIKHDPALPVRAAEFCLNHAGLQMGDVDHVVFYEKPLKKFDRIMRTQLRSFPHGAAQFSRSMATWLSDRLWLKGNLAKTFACAPERLLFLDHHLSHAASAFLPSGFADAAVITVDGVGEWATTSIFKGDTDPAGRPRLDPLKELHFPHSIGLLYSALTAYLGFEVNGGEYKVMGLSSYGQPLYLDQLLRTCQIDADASLTVSDRYYAWTHSAERGFTSALEDLLGPARVPGSPLVLDGSSLEGTRYADVAASVQALCEMYMLALCAEAKRLTGSDNVCLAGGVALNSVANRRLAEDGPFGAVYVHPAAGDAGGALGAALYVSQVAGNDPRTKLSHAFLGADHDLDHVRTLLKDARADFTIHDDEDRLFDDVGARLARGQVGGWSRGRFEWGPRALGARSILADPRTHAMRDRVNAHVKRREPFRPFAPSVLKERAGDYFDLGRGRDTALLQTMCSVLPAKERARREAPAVVHVDGTSRVHTVDETQRDLHGVMSAFEARTGVGALLHTSMNLKDEPICASATEAWATFVRSDLDFLVLDDAIVTRSA